MKKSPWIRLYRESLHNPKIVSLTDRQHRVWHNLLVMTNDDGELPKIRDIACHLRMSVPDAEAVISELVEAGLVDVDVLSGPGRKFAMHDWTTHQYVSDVSTERVRKFRNKNNHETDETGMKRPETVSETPPESESESDTDTLGLSSSPSAAREAKDLKVVNALSKGRNDKTKDRLTRRAEGLGLDVAEITEAVIRHKPGNRSAYFTTIAIQRLALKLPGIDQGMLRAALWDKGDESYNAVMQLLLVAA